jgi:hypothetical protein
MLVDIPLFSDRAADSPCFQQGRDPALPRNTIIINEVIAAIPVYHRSAA